MWREEARRNDARRREARTRVAQAAMETVAAAKTDEEKNDFLAYWPKLFRNNSCFQCLVPTLLCIGILLMCILIPLHFSYIEYSDWGFKKNTLNNEVSMGTVYGHGRYGWGVSMQPVTFPRGFQKEELKLYIFPQNGLEFDVDIVFFWRIEREKLGELFKKFGQSYRSQIEARANAKIKNRAPDFTIEQYITERPMITHELHQVLQEELNLIHIEVPEDKFFLLNVNLPESIRERDLDTAVREQRNLEEQNKQLVETVKKETERLEQGIQANVTITRLKANSEYENIILRAYAVGNRTVSDSDSGGSNHFFASLNVTDAETKSLYIRYFRFAESVSL